MKEKFIQSTIILMIGGLLTKLLGMIIKITIARKIGSEGLGLYMLILPTFLLFINISQLGLPLALSKLVAEEKRSTKELFFSTIPILLIIHILLIAGIIFFAPFLSKNLLHNQETYWSILAIALVLPFTSTSSICRSYFLGKQKMLPHVISNITEDLVRLLLIYFGITHFLSYGLKYAVCYLVLSNIISESSSTLVFLFFLPKQIKLKKQDLIPNKENIKDTLLIGIPNTASRFLGSIAFFLEPIILTNGLLKCGYTTTYITKEYGILSGYVMPLILLPSFFSQSISQALLPILSKEYANHEKQKAKRKLLFAILITLGMAIPITLLLTLFPTLFLKMIYHTEEGAFYIKLLAPICILEYLQAPLASCLDAMGKTKDNLIASLLGMSTRTILLYFLSSLRIGLFCLLIAIGCNIVITTLYQIKKIKE
ncbi:MAG: oligosaccharide flippase family protein [Bacilli bacterium]|nr:oligosaccharide flippase family protein [Bacilli bacterium]